MKISLTQLITKEVNLIIPIGASISRNKEIMKVTVWKESNKMDMDLKTIFIWQQVIKMKISSQNKTFKKGMELLKESQVFLKQMNLSNYDIEAIKIL